jgi:hypothetical protein
MQKIMWLLLLGVLSLQLSCTTTPDVPFCAQINPGRAVCTYTISGDEKDFVWDDTNLHNGKTWYDAKTSMVMVPVKESWIPIRNYIIKQCKQSGQCTDKQISSWDRKEKAMGISVVEGD